MRTIFAENLARLRQKAGVSQREAAEALQVSQALLSHYEKGIREPGLDFVVRAADYYGVPTDLLLGHDSGSGAGPAADSQDASPLPPFAREVAQGLRGSLDVMLGLLRRYYDPQVFLYATIYISEVFYEILRHFYRLSEDYDPDFFALDDDHFNSGALMLDLTWVRTQYVRAIRRFLEINGRLPAIDPAGMEEDFGEAYPSFQRLMQLVGRRLARQDMADRQIPSALFDAGDDSRLPQQSISEQEDPHD